MVNPKEWLRRKLDEPCACSSGRPYHRCCLRKEAAYLVIGVVAAALLFGYRRTGIIGVVVVLVLSLTAGVLVNWHCGRGKNGGG